MGSRSAAGSDDFVDRIARRKRILIETSGNLEELLDAIDVSLTGDAKVSVSDAWFDLADEFAQLEGAGEGEQDGFAFLSEQLGSRRVPR